MVHGLSCSEACGIFLDQGSKLCPLHWQVDSLPRSYQGSLILIVSVIDLEGGFWEEDHRGEVTLTSHLTRGHTSNMTYHCGSQIWHSDISPLKNKVTLFKSLLLCVVELEKLARLSIQKRGGNVMWWRTAFMSQKDLGVWAVFLLSTWVILDRSNQSILKEISPEYLLEGLMLKLQNFGHLMKRVNSLEKTLMLGKIEGRRRRG